MRIPLLAIVGLLVLTQAVIASEKQGAYLGAQTSESPHWFKNSFLDFEEDVAEAAESNKRVMIYFSQDGCPYCARLVEENFTDPEIEAFVRKHFDGITINMWGDREVVSVGGNSYTEKNFASALKVQYTPTLLFLNEQGKTILRLNGYYPPERFRSALRFVALKKEQQMSFSDYMLSLQPAAKGGLIHEDFFTPTSNIQSLVGKNQLPLAVYFEAAACEQCEVMHQRILTDAPTRALAHSINNVQIDVNSDRSIITHDGQRMSAADYARSLDIGYTPSVVFFDQQGDIVHRIDGFLKTFHFQSSIAYVLEQGYREQPSFQRYLAARGEMLREKGFDTDIWGYESSYTDEVQRQTGSAEK